MEKFGGQRIDIERSLLQPGDIVVEPWCNNADVELPSDSVGWLEGLTYEPYSWMNLYGGTKSSAAGFYGADLGPVPFAVGRLPGQIYFVVRVFSRVLYDSQPSNPREVQSGGVPSFDNLSYSVGREITYLKPTTIREVQLAAQARAEGKVPEAIQYYRRALEVDSNNPVVLNNLAWLLASASKPELRNGEEAVQLATRAVELTDSRQPLFIGTLAAAYAEAGQVSEARRMGNIGRGLALLTGQQDVADQIAKLLTMCSSDKAVDATLAP
ncbi:MAG: tetratricopeptide repeat protein [Verrucomicrobiota bacterium]|jgi:tetratricopeptide (TPR) repeat protein